MSEMPKSVKKVVQKKDLRMKYLNEWKKLFESIYEDIRVFIYKQDNFDSVIKETFGDIEFPTTYFKMVRILVILPEELDLEYLVGLSYNHMFSHIEVLQDPLLAENFSYDCESNLDSW